MRGSCGSVGASRHPAVRRNATLPRGAPRTALAPRTRTGVARVYGDELHVGRHDQVVASHGHVAHGQGRREIGRSLGELLVLSLDHVELTIHGVSLKVLLNDRETKSDAARSKYGK